MERMMASIHLLTAMPLARKNDARSALPPFRGQSGAASKKKTCCRPWKLLCLLLLGGAALLSTSCQQQAFTPYKGYKMSPYTLKGQRYVPMGIESALQYDATGLASWYEADGKAGAIGQRLYEGQLYAAHRTLPLPCKVRITSVETGRSCVARVADRGPFIPGRLIDVSSAVAHKLGFHRAGLHPVRIQVLSVGDGAYEVKR